jgi:hypothetical protein
MEVIVNPKTLEQALIQQLNLFFFVAHVEVAYTSQTERGDRIFFQVRVRSKNDLAYGHQSEHPFEKLTNPDISKSILSEIVFDLLRTVYENELHGVA